MLDWLYRLMPWYNEKAVTDREQRSNEIYEDAHHTASRADQVYKAYAEYTLTIAHKRARGR